MQGTFCLFSLGGMDTLRRNIKTLLRVDQDVFLMLTQQEGGTCLVQGWVQVSLDLMAHTSGKGWVTEVL